MMSLRPEKVPKFDRSAVVQNASSSSHSAVIRMCSCYCFNM